MSESKASNILNNALCCLILTSCFATIFFEFNGNSKNTTTVASQPKVAETIEAPEQAYGDLVVMMKNCPDLSEMMVELMKDHILTKDEAQQLYDESKKIYLSQYEWQRKADFFSARKATDPEFVIPEKPYLECQPIIMKDGKERIGFEPDTVIY